MVADQVHKYLHDINLLTCLPGRNGSRFLIALQRLECDKTKDLDVSSGCTSVLRTYVRMQMRPNHHSGHPFARVLVSWIIGGSSHGRVDVVS